MKALTQITSTAMLVARELDRAFASGSIANAREAVAGADRRKRMLWALEVAELDSRVDRSA